MKETKPIDIRVLQEEAKNNQHKESYRVLEGSRNYRIGVGARLESSGQTSFFLEILIYFCPDPPKIDLSFLEKNMTFLRELKTKGYSLNCEDNCISCETAVPPKNLAAEYETIRSITKKIFRKQG